MKSREEIKSQIRSLDIRKIEIKESIGNIRMSTDGKTIVEGSPYDIRDVKVIDSYISALQWVLD